jgi:hypothetical protein
LFDGKEIFRIFAGDKGIATINNPDYLNVNELNIHATH